MIDFCDYLIPSLPPSLERLALLLWPQILGEHCMAHLCTRDLIRAIVSSEVCRGLTEFSMASMLNH